MNNRAIVSKGGHRILYNLRVVLWVHLEPLCWIHVFFVSVCGEMALALRT